jgi:hypothetical protein
MMKKENVIVRVEESLAKELELQGYERVEEQEKPKKASKKES